MGTPEKIQIALTFTILLAFFLAWFFSHRARHRETLLMIEKGMNPNEFKGISRWGFALRKIGVVLVGLGFGSAIFWLLLSLGVRSVNSDAGSLATFAISVGSALLIDSRYGSKKED